MQHYKARHISKKGAPIRDGAKSATTKLWASGLALSVALLVASFSSRGYAPEAMKIGVVGLK